jgi:uncharacterized protein
VPNHRSHFRLNVGFIINQNVGFSSKFPLEEARFLLEPDLEATDLSGTVRITRTPQGLLVQVQIKALVQAECVRCLSDFSQPLSVDFTELYAFSKRSVTESGLILPEDGHIDLDPLVREYILLDIPMSPLCKPDCKGLCPICGENFNENDHDHDLEASDPRLEVLKSLLEQQDEPADEE